MIEVQDLRQIDINRWRRSKWKPVLVAELISFDIAQESNINNDTDNAQALLLLTDVNPSNFSKTEKVITFDANSLTIEDNIKSKMSFATSKLSAASCNAPTPCTNQSILHCCCHSSRSGQPPEHRTPEISNVALISLANVNDLVLLRVLQGRLEVRIPNMLQMRPQPMPRLRHDHRQ